jgi:hypothetical protein
MQGSLEKVQTAAMIFCGRFGAARSDDAQTIHTML